MRWLYPDLGLDAPPPPWVEKWPLEKYRERSRDLGAVLAAAERAAGGRSAATPER